MRRPKNFNIHPLKKEDIPLIVSAFAQADWPKPASTFDAYLHEQEAGQRLIWVGWLDNNVAGYVTLVWNSLYKPFHAHAIPEIMDLNVLPQHRNQSIGSNLLAYAEDAAQKKSEYVGLGVGLYADYGRAQQLYVKRGYLPDGRGITYKYQSVSQGNMVHVDDDLVLWFTKRLRSS